MNDSGTGRRALATLMSVALIGTTFTTAFVVPNIARAETIIVEACNVGMIELRTGNNVTCIDPNEPERGGGDGGKGGDDTYDDGGLGGARPRPQPSPAERRRVARCKQCQASSRTCQAQALFARMTCVTNAANQARERCDILGRGVTFTVTAWGCSIFDHSAGLCGGQVESPWNQPERWAFGCQGKGRFRSCGGPAVDNCASSWRTSHPAGSVAIGTSGELSATFEGVGGQATQTTTETYQWDGRNGYLAACEDAAMNLAHHCTGRENACYQANQCSAEDL